MTFNVLFFDAYNSIFGICSQSVFKPLTVHSKFFKTQIYQNTTYLIQSKQRLEQKSRYTFADFSISIMAQHLTPFLVGSIVSNYIYIYIHSELSLKMINL